MNIFGVGLPEIAVIAALALVVFGPKKLPEIGKNLGKTLKSLQKASSEFEKEFQSAIESNEESTTDSSIDSVAKLDSDDLNK